MDPIIAQVQKNFESIKKEQDGFEFWSARELPEVIEKAKDFALAMTDHNIKEKNFSGKYKLEEEVVKNSKATRQTLLSRGIRPEDLKADEDVKKIEQRRKKEQKFLKKK